MYSIMNAVKFNGELNAQDAAVKCRDTTDELQSNIFGVDCRNQSTKNHHQHGKANVDTLLAGGHVEIDLEERVRQNNQSTHCASHQQPQKALFLPSHQGINRCIA